MAIVSCPECSKKLKVADTSVGKKVRCSCGNIFVAQAEAAPAAAPPVVAAGGTPEKVYVACTECGAKLKVGTTSLGKKMKCPKCGGVFVAQLPEERPAPPPEPEPEFADDDLPPPPPMAKPIKAAKPVDDDDLMSFAEDEARAGSPFADEDEDMPKPKGKAKPQQFEDEDEEPAPMAKPGKKPPVMAGDGKAAGKPVYPRRILPNILVTLLLFALAAVFAIMFFGKEFDIDPAHMVGIQPAKGVKAVRKFETPKDKGADIDKDKNGDKDKQIDAVPDKTKEGDKGKEIDGDKEKDKEPTGKGKVDQAKIAAAKIQIGLLTKVTEAFKVKNSKFPQSLIELTQPDDFGVKYLESKNALLDPWKRTYQYNPDGPKNDGARPDIWTVTPNKQVIGNWDDEAPKQKDKDADNGKGGNAKTTPAKLEGTWIVQSASTNGKPDNQMKGEKFVFADGKVTGFGPNTVPYTVDLTKNPNTIDIAFAKELTVKGIFKLEGDTLQICVPGEPDQPRPSKFDPAGTAMITLQRPGKETAGGGYSRLKSTNNLKQIVLAMHNHHGAYKAFPSAAISDASGKPLLSWRVAILPYLEEIELFQAFDLTKPWDDPHNLKLIAKMPKIYVVPGVEAKEGMTHYRTLVGPGTPMEPQKGPDGKLIGRKVQVMTDGTSNIIVAVEAKDPTIWTRPDDLTYDPKGPLPKFGVSPQGFNAAFADGTVRFIGANVADDILRPYFTCNNGMPRQPLPAGK